MAEHYAAPYDLLAAALGAPPARTRAVVARWRARRVRRHRRSRPRPGVVLAHPRRDGRDRPAVARPPARRWRAWRTYRAVLAARLWLQASPA